MRLDLSTHRRRAGIGLTPLIDVVFILLLFFLLASQFDHFGALQLHVPAAGPERPAADTAGALRIQLLADGRVALNAAPVTLADLGARLAQARAADPGLVVLVATDPDTTLQSLVALLDVLAAAGVRDPRLQ